MNCSTGVLILALALDSLMFLILLTLGIALGLLLFLSAYGEILWNAGQEDTIVAAYMLIAVYVLSALFARNKEMYHAKMLLIKDKRNEKLEKQVTKRDNKFVDALNAKNDFLNNISNEITTPVHTISNASETLIKNLEKLPEKDIENLAIEINENSTQLVTIMNRILSVSRPNYPKVIFDMQVANLEDIVKDSIRDTHILVKKKNIKVDFYRKKHIETRTLFDKERISHVLKEMITNAVKHSSQNGYIRVDICQKYAKLPSGITINGLCVSVKYYDNSENTGLKSLFGLLKQTTNHSYFKISTRTGSPTSAEILSAHSGILWTEKNDKDKLSTSYCVLPYPNNRVTLDEDKSENQKFNILFVDDDEGCRIAGRMILENIGYNVKLFSSGIELMDYLKYTDKSVDIILLDMMMPDMDGLEVIHEIRKKKQFLKTPIILQTGIRCDLDLPELQQYNPLDYLLKPYNKEDLQEKIEYYLKKTSLTI